MGDLFDAYEMAEEREWERNMRARIDTARNGGTEMTNSKLAQAQGELERMLREAQAQADEVERLTEQARTHPEPGDGMVVYFNKYFPRARGGSSEYEFAAIRKHDKWYHTGKSQFLNHHGLPQPCSWEQLVDFAYEVSVVVDYAPVNGWEGRLDDVLDRKDHGDLNSEAWTEHDKVVDRERFLRQALEGLVTWLDNEAYPGKRMSKESLRDTLRAARNDLDRHTKMKEGK